MKGLLQRWAWNEGRVAEVGRNEGLVAEMGMKLNNTARFLLVLCINKNQYRYTVYAGGTQVSL